MASGFTELASFFQSSGIMDFLLPFLLVFTIVFAVTGFMPLFKSQKNFRVIIALVLGLVFVVPHITGTYPLGYDPVQVMNDALPSISLVAIAAVMVLILLGVFGKDFSKNAAPLVAVVSVGFVIYIFGAALNLWTGPYDLWSWWTDEVTELVIILLIFGLVIWFITRDPSESSWKDTAEKSWKGLGSVLKKAGDDD